ncbi:MAG: hypothetical protein HY674_08145 [Chloroflexi bacterium]|nr:hypothetical protein [Chloroflexota bacterium]
MTDKQAVIDALNRLPEAASLEEITEELHIMAPSGADAPTSPQAAPRAMKMSSNLLTRGRRHGLQSNLV